MAHVEENGIALDRLTAQQIEDSILRAVPGGEIDAALRNKVNMTSEICPDLDTFIEVNKYMTVTSDTQNRPALAVVDFGRVINIGTDSTTFLQILYARGSAILYRGYAAWETPKFHRWRMVADNTPPQEYDLPLAAGVTGTVRYSKDQFGTVRLSGLISFPSDTTGISIFGTLPNGFRPQNGQYISSCGWLEGGANVVPLMLAVNADGTVAANMFAASTKYVVVQAVFLAA